jgi:hypothetical protein
VSSIVKKLFEQKPKKEFEVRIHELIVDCPDLAAIIGPLLIAWRTLREQFAVFHRRLLAVVRDDAVCHRLMTVSCRRSCGKDVR